MATVTKIDPRNPADAEALRAELLKIWPDAARYMRPAVDYWGTPFAESHCWGDGERCGCWFAYAQHAWTDESWGWQSVEPNAAQLRAMRCEPCALGGWLVRDVVSIGD